MASAFIRSDDTIDTLEDISARVPSTQRNLVTPHGLAQIEQEAEKARIALADGEREQDRRAIALAARDLNYWSARRASAELVKPIADTTEARFGHTVTIAMPNGKQRSFHIVGEDEADPAKGSVPHVAPVAKALMGHGVGAKVLIMKKRATIVEIAA